MAERSRYINTAPSYCPGASDKRETPLGSPFLDIPLSRACLKEPAKMGRMHSSGKGEQRASAAPCDAIEASLILIHSLNIIIM